MLYEVITNPHATVTSQRFHSSAGNPSLRGCVNLGIKSPPTDAPRLCSYLVSREHFWKFADSSLAPEFLLEPHEKGTGIRGLFYGEEGFRHFFSSKPLANMGSLAGMKIRVSNDPIMNGMVKGLGASPTVVSYNELYSALQTGVVDAAEQPIANYKSKAFNEVAPYMILDGHTLGAIQVIITDEAWDKLSPAQQKAMTEAGKIASAYNRSISYNFV